MPLKWKIFKAINIINWALIFPMIVILFIFYSRHLSNEDPKLFLLLFFMFILTLFILLVNSIYHFAKTRSSVILNEQPVNFSPAGSKLLFAFCLLCIIGLIVFFIFGVQQEFFNTDEYQPRRDDTGKYVLLYALFLIGINTYIAIMQIQLLKLLTKAQTETLNQVINSIGITADDPVL